MDAARLTAVERLLRSRYPDRGPGAAVLLVVEDAPVLVAGYGRADVRAGEPVTPATLFDLASVSKHFTAYAVLLLASRGQLAVDDEVARSLPELAAYETGGRPLRLGDLLHHCSGLADYIEEVDPDDYPDCTNSYLLAWLTEEAPRFAPGERGFFLTDDDPPYCNTNYALLASVVERVSGLPFADFLQREVFRPLRMRDTFCDPWQPDHPGQAKRYDRAGRKIAHPRVIPVYGDGNVYSTVADLVRWDAELARPTLLDPAWLDRAFVPGSLDDGRPTDYAGGWYVKRWPGRRVAWHGGSWDGTSTCFSRWLDDGVRIALLSNTQQHAACEVVSEIENLLLD
jgi:CubicO group peptidase (beta-lactamase class C family)